MAGPAAAQRLTVGARAITSLAALAPAPAAAPAAASLIARLAARAGRARLRGGGLSGGNGLGLLDGGRSLAGAEAKALAASLAEAGLS